MASPERRVGRLTVRIAHTALTATAAALGAAIAHELGAALANSSSLTSRARVDVRVTASAQSTSAELVSRVVAAAVEALR